jgi:hypothetical protein
MTPDTTIYMIAGFVVILLGIIVRNRILDQKNK